MSAGRLTLRGRLNGVDDGKLAWLLSLQPELIARLRGCERTLPGLEQAAARRLGTLSAELTPVQERILGLDADGLQDLASRSGAVRHAQAVLRLVDGTTLRRFVAAAGPAARDSAMHWHALVTGHAAPPYEDALEDAVLRDGWICLRSWCEAQPSAVGMRVLMLLPSTPQADGEDNRLGASIVDALAGEAHE